MPALSEYINVFGTAVRIMREKGFRVWFDADRQLFGAEKNGWDFFSDSPCGLLGLVAIYEQANPSRYEEYWWRRAGDPDFYLNLTRDAPEYVSICEETS